MEQGFSIWQFRKYLFLWFTVSAHSLGDGTYERCQNQNPIPISFQLKAEANYISNPIGTVKWCGLILVRLWLPSIQLYYCITFAFAQTMTSHALHIYKNVKLNLIINVLSNKKTKTKKMTKTSSTIHCDPSIRSDKEQHSEFLLCLSS